MAAYVISCCSTADISKEHLTKRDIHYLCFHFEIDGKSYPDDLGESVPFPKFYEAMAQGADTKTSQINISEYLDYFEGFLREGLDVLHVSLSSGLSGTVNSAMNAANIAMERYPGRKIIVLDSLAASSGYGLLMDKIADLRDEGMELDALSKWVMENRLKLHHWFFSTDLKFYIKGGRVSKTSGVIAGMLSICPLLDMDERGRLTPRAKVRTKRRVKEETVKRMLTYADGGANYAGKCYICHSACMDDALDVARMVEAQFPHLNGRVEINDIGTTIGSHTGPGTVALFFWGKTRGGEK